VATEERRAFFECDEITKDFGGLRALSDVSFGVAKREIVGIIGPNGAGKTTLFNVINGTLRPTHGSLWLDGSSMSNLKPHVVCQMGVGRTYQTVRPFLGFTALQNVVAGLLFGTSAQKAGIKVAKQKAAEFLNFVGLSGKESVPANNLNLVERKKVELARALAGSPKLILLDEILSGLNPRELEGSMALIRRIRDELGITVMWIEHLMKALMGVCERVIVLHHGRVIAEGTPQEISSNTNVSDVYLGGRRAQ
jgi:branched-chain amino acid transport system ATP-binding protein